MTRILIAGGGGFGLEVLDYLLEDISNGQLAEHTFGGILNDGADCEVLRKSPQTAYAGTIAEYRPQADDAVIIAVGSVAGRKKIAALMAAVGAPLFTYAHSSARISRSARLGRGAIVCPNSIVNAGASVDENAVVNVFCSIGHGSRVGAHSVISPFCSLSGDSALGALGFMGTRATLFPKVQLGRQCVVDAHSAVRQSAPDGKLISVRGEYRVIDNRNVIPE